MWGCGTPSGLTGAGTVTQDSGVEQAVDAGIDDEMASFARRVRETMRAVQDAGSPGCASAVPMELTDGGPALRQRALDAVSRVTGVPSANIFVEPTPCGQPGFADCATRFQNHMYHLVPPMGDALLPLAKEVDRTASLGDLVIWTPQVGGSAQAADVSHVGIRAGRAYGFIFFSGRTNCEP